MQALLSAWTRAPETAMCLAGSAMAGAMSIPATGTAFTIDGYYPGAWWNGASGERDSERRGSHVGSST